MGADQLVGVGIVGDDVAGRGDGHRIDGVRGKPDRPGQLDRAVLVGVFKANVEDGGGLPAVEPFF